jgi:hypothetical protein
MARKLNLEEERLFARAWASGERLPAEAGEEWFQERLSKQRDTALSLSPELGMWFGAEFTTRSDS